MRLTTPRLILRPVAENDFEAMYEMGQDPRVMEFLGPLQTKEEVHRFIKKIQEHQKAYGFSYLAIEHKTSNQFLGLVGLLVPSYPLPFSPCVEIGWRLKFEAWGHGHAFEAAQELMRWGFEEKKLNEIVSFTAVINKRSEELMKRLRMTSDAKENFLHPKVSEGDPLREHVLYRKLKHFRE